MGVLQNWSKVNFKVYHWAVVIISHVSLMNKALDMLHGVYEFEPPLDRLLWRYMRKSYMHSCLSIDVLSYVWGILRKFFMHNSLPIDALSYVWGVLRKSFMHNSLPIDVLPYVWGILRKSFIAWLHFISLLMLCHMVLCDTVCTSDFLK